MAHIFLCISEPVTINRLTEPRRARNFSTMKKYLTLLIVALFVTISFGLTSCGNSRAEEALQAYEKIADELVEARANYDFKRQMEIAVELRGMQAEYSDVKAEDLNDDQRERLANVMKKVAAGGYEEMLRNPNKMIEKMTEQYSQPKE